MILFHFNKYNRIIFNNGWIKKRKKRWKQDHGGGNPTSCSKNKWDLWSETPTHVLKWVNLYNPLIPNKHNINVSLI